MADKNGKGSWPSRNNWGAQWDNNYDQIDWNRKPNRASDKPDPKDRSAELQEAENTAKKSGAA